MKKFILLLVSSFVLWTLLYLSGCGARTGLPDPGEDPSLVITDVQPRVIMPGTPFTVIGGTFNLTPGNNILTIGATTVPVTAATSTTLTATMPADFPSGEYTVSVAANGLTAKFEGTIKVISVYVVGWEGNGAKYWKNTVATDLITGANSTKLVASDIFVNHKDVHIVGANYSSDSLSRAVYWLNGAPTFLTSSEVYSYAHSVVVTPLGDIYVGGDYYNLSTTGKRLITYWKNGTKQTDITDGSKYGWSSAMDASDTDVVIVGGNTGTTNPFAPAMYWINGVPKPLSSSANLGTTGWGIKLNGTDVYVAGEIVIDPVTGKTNPEYWLNGIGTTLSPSSASSPGRTFAYSIATSGSDVYFGGSMWQDPSTVIGGYWKLGTTPFVNVTDPSNGQGFPLSIAVSGSDVFVVGGQAPNGGHTIAKLWINGLEYKLTDGTQVAFAAAIFIK